MTALTASFLLNEPFKNSRQHSNSSINGIKHRENKETKLEFIEAGVLKPPELPPNVIRLVPKNAQKHATVEKTSLNYSNGFMHIFTKSEASSYNNNSSPEGEPASSGSSTYPSEGNTPESITKSLTSVPSPKLLQSSLVNGLEAEAEEDESDENLTLRPLIPLPPTPPKIPRRIEVKALTPSSPKTPSPTKLIGPQIPPGYVFPSSPGTSTPTLSTPPTQKGLKRKRERLLSERFELEALYPVLDKTIASLNSWTDCKQLKGRPALAGIRNPHNNCFLNSVLQGVCHIPQIGRYLIEVHLKGCSQCMNNGSCLLCSLRMHFFTGLTREVNDASWINKYLEDIFPNHMRGSQEDAHEMLLFLLDSIDRQQQSIRRSQPGKFSSIVEQVFDGKVRSEYTCLTCNKKSICYEPIRGLSVELPRQVEVPPEMSKVIRDYFADEKIAGYDCRSCKRKTVANKRTRIVTAPRVLIVQLKRFLRFTKITTLVIPTQQINLNDVMHDRQNTPYRMLGYIKHIGGTMSSGHYTATMCGFDGKNVYQFDDDCRSTSGFPTKASQPYILFYSQEDVDTKTTPAKSPLPTPAKKPNLNGISQNSPFLGKKNNDNGQTRKGTIPENFLSSILSKNK